ncbi:MAG: hypothetical protein ABIJ09_21685 [Pseudomonadota bacterium]
MRRVAPWYLLALPATALAAAPGAMPTPVPAPPPASACWVLFEDMGSQGMRISETQSIAQTVQTELNNRVGRDRALYGGLATMARQMKKMLAGSPTSTEMQDKQIASYESCKKSAPWRVVASFGYKNKKHWIAVRCSAARTPTATISETRTEGARFEEAHAALKKAMGTFCPTLQRDRTPLP